MNALYLTYAILAVTYFLLGKTWNTKWLQQGNYLFLAVVASLMLSRPLVEYGVAYYSGYLTEQITYYQQTLSTTQVSVWVALTTLPLLGLFNYIKAFRENKIFQLVLWCVVVSTILFTGSYCDFQTYLFGYPIETSFLPGWHSAITLPQSGLLLTLFSSVGITSTLAWVLKKRNVKE